MSKKEFGEWDRMVEDKNNLLITTADGTTTVYSISKHECLGIDFEEGFVRVFRNDQLLALIDKSNVKSIFVLEKPDIITSNTRELQDKFINKIWRCE